MFVVYFLLRKDFVLRCLFFVIMVLIMYFGVGLILIYLLYRLFGFLNIFWVYIVLVFLGMFNVVVVRSYIELFFLSLIEFVKIDGVSEFRILW